VISITCTNCKTILTIDEAFAGGVCRCQHCGTIQTVPAAPRPTGGLAPKATAVSKSLYQGQERSKPGPTAATELAELADAVASSGLSGSGLANRRNTESQSPAALASRESAEQPLDRRGLLLIIVAASALAVLAVGAVIALLLMRGPGSSGNSGAPISPGTAAPGASFCGMSLEGNKVIFLLDRGNSISNWFDTLKFNCFKALKSLGPDRQFQVILWDNDTDSVAFPSDGMRNATAGAIENCQHDLQDVAADGNSHLRGPMKEALDRQPDLIVIATAKTDLDEADAAALRSAVQAGVRIDAIQIGLGTLAKVLQDACKQTGGQIKIVSGPEMRQLSQD